MSNPFVWFHHNGENPSESSAFYQRLCGFTASEGPAGMTLLAAPKGPFAGLGGRYGDAPGWIPFLEVPDVDASTARAVELGAILVRAKSRGPAGEFSVVRDPGGAAVALWQKA